MSNELSPFLRQKYEYLFHQFYDSNKNGIVTHSDFVDTIKGLQKFRHWPSGDERLKVCKTTLNSAWNALKQSADANKDQKVNLDEWFQYWGKFVEESRESPDGWPSNILWVKDFMNFWFDLMDTSGDGFVDKNEFIQVCAYFGVAEVEANAAFKKLGATAIDRDQFSRLWLEFMTSEDDTVPGNFIFGKPSWN